MIAQSMLIYSTNWHGLQTFRMLPINKKCPFNEVIYDPLTKVLAIVSKEFKEKPHMFDKLHSSGKPLFDATSERTLEERLFMDTYYEYYLDDIDDIKSFVSRFAINSAHEAVKVIDETFVVKTN